MHPKSKHVGTETVSISNNLLADVYIGELNKNNRTNWSLMIAADHIQDIKDFNVHQAYLENDRDLSNVLDGKLFSPEARKFIESLLAKPQVIIESPYNN